MIWPLGYCLLIALLDFYTAEWTDVRGGAWVYLCGGVAFFNSRHRIYVITVR